MKNRVWITIMLCVYGFVIKSISQERIDLMNPSFEDMPRKGGSAPMPIKGWVDCGVTLFPNETPPDILPDPGNAWFVKTKAYDGLTYLSLVTRYNNTYESVSQALRTTLKKDKCYTLIVFLARSPIYQSMTKRSGTTLEDFTNPAILKIWAGNAFCETLQLIAQSTPVDHEDWVEYKFDFKPDRDYKYITLAASYRDDVPEPYNGHIMVDKLSAIVEVECK